MNNYKTLLNNPHYDLKIIKNPNDIIYKEASAAVLANDGYCPCGLVKNDDTKCICANLRASQKSELCHCGRFLKIVDAPMICLCGSTRFKNDFMIVAAELSKSGYIVLMPAVFAHSDNIILTDEEKARLDELHKAKIAYSSAIVVINKNGYIGDSTLSEIAFAEELSKTIYYLEEE